MVRRHAVLPSSLDLILDIVCNTFGCVVLLSLLVALMGRGTVRTLEHKLQTLKERVYVAQMQYENRMLQTELMALKSALQNLPSEMASSAELGQKLQEQLSRVTKELEFLEKTVLDAKKQHHQLEKELQALEGTNQELRVQLQHLKNRLVQQVEEFRLSTERQNPGISFVSVVIRFGRVYVWHQYDSALKRVGPNLEDFVVVGESSEGILTLPRVDRGIPLTEPDAAQRVRQRLKTFPPKRWAIDVAMWEDSFDHWGMLRRILVEDGYYYRMLLMKEGQTLVDRGGRDSLVQ